MEKIPKLSMPAGPHAVTEPQQSIADAAFGANARDSHIARLAQALQSSPRQTVQRRLADRIHASPVTVSQRKRSDVMSSAVFRAIADAQAVDAETLYGNDIAYPTLGFTSRPEEAEGPDIDYRATESQGT
jgi:hypothetical protein